MMRVFFFFKSKCLRVLLALFLISCVMLSCDSESLLGTDIIPASDKTTYLYDSLDVSILTEKYGKELVTDMDTAVFGTYNDPVFGVSKGEFVADFLTADEDSMNFGTDPVLDSLVILIPHETGHCGDVNVPQTINVYELADTLGADDDSNPTIGSNAFDFTGTSFYKPDLLASVSFQKKFRITSTVMSYLDVSITGETLYNQLDGITKDIPYTEKEFFSKLPTLNGVMKDIILKNLEFDTIRIALPYEFAKRATGFITGTINEDMVVLEYMRGFYFQSAASNNACLFRLDLINSLVRMYYHNSTTTGLSFDFTVNSRTFRHNHLTHDYSSTINNAINAGESDVSYIQGMHGLRTKLQIQGIEKFAGKNINKAELVIGIDSLSQDYKYSYTPDQLGIYKINSTSVIDSLPEYYYSSSTLYQPQHTTADKRYYNFLITSYVNQLLNKKNLSGLYIQNYEGDDLRKLILLRKKIKLKLTYSNLIQF